MGAKPYPAYKDSGVEWIGDIPEHWEVKPNSSFMRLVSNKVGGQSSQFPVLSLTQRGVIVRDLDSNDGKYPASFDGYQLVGTDNLVFCLFDIDETPRTVGLVKHSAGIITNAYTAITLDKRVVDPNFVEKYYIAIDDAKRLKPFYTGLRKVVQKSRFFSIRIQLPPLEEQKQIAEFLDRETSKIDTLIDKQQQLINLLKEKRGSLISHTVTKGLNPNVPMKDSGVEWIGDIPEHWDVKRLKDVAASVGVGLVINPSTYVLDFPSDEDVPMLLGSNVVPFGFNLKSVRRISPEDNLILSASRLKAGDIVVVRVGAPGVAAVIPPYLDSSNCASVVIVRQHRRFEPQWLVYVLNSPVVSSQVDIVKYGAAQKQFNVSHAVAFIIPSPPLEEQQQIATYLDEETSKIDTLIEKANQSIALLKERRSSLISAAVTGKIDVRGAV